MNLAVCGSAADHFKDSILRKAFLLGKIIAEKGHTLLTGGSGGLPYQAVLGCHEAGGKSIGYSAAINLQQHISYKQPTHGFTEFVFIPRNYEYASNKLVSLKYRNISLVAAADAVIIIGGRIGTMNEFTIAYDLGKPIGILEGTGGITNSAIKVLVAEAGKESPAAILRESDPSILVDKISQIYTNSC